ncbi:MAG: hypothetical protein RIR26_1088 [Pseudomonadota bacterium]
MATEKRSSSVKRGSGKSREVSFEPLRRILYLHNLLRRTSEGRRVTAERLTEQLNTSGFDVSLRTVQRYLENFEIHFTGIRHDNAKPIGWWWEASAADDTLHVSKETALALCLAEAHLKHLLPSAELKHLTPLFQHARKMVEFGGDVNRYKRMLDRIWIFPRGWQLQPPRIEGRIFDQIMNAILESKEIEIKYKKAGEKQPRMRRIEPLGMVERSGVYYVVGREKLSEVPKNWAMHRIEEVKEVSFFSYPKGFKIAEYARSGSLNVQFEPRTIELHLVLSPAAGAHLLESRLSDDQRTQVRDDDAIEVYATVANTLELRWWLMGLAADCEILDPQELREDICRMLSEGLRRNASHQGKRAG